MFAHSIKVILCLFAIFLVIIILLTKTSEFSVVCSFEDILSSTSPTLGYTGDQILYAYDREMPLIFIGGVPRSGTSLMRVILDAHPDVRCGQDIEIIPKMLHAFYNTPEMEVFRTHNGGVTNENMNDAIAKFCLEIIMKHAEPAPRLCVNHSFLLEWATILKNLFPKSKFLFMVRDGRAVVHSILSRNITHTDFYCTSYEQCLENWDRLVSVMNNQCSEIGEEHCMLVNYEQLVLQPKLCLEKILKFLNLHWNDAVLHHDDFINKPNGVQLSKFELSIDQLIKPINLEPLSQWFGKIPEDVVHHVAKIAPMLLNLSYDPFSSSPAYGEPDEWVQLNTFKVQANRLFWYRKIEELMELNDTVTEKFLNVVYEFEY